jgi:hypothetical protein
VEWDLALVEDLEGAGGQEVEGHRAEVQGRRVEAEGRAQHMALHLGHIEKRRGRGMRAGGGGSGVDKGKGKRRVVLQGDVTAPHDASLPPLSLFQLHAPGRRPARGCP